MKIVVAVYHKNWDGSDLTDYLKMKGHEVEEAKTSFILFEALKQGDYELVFVSQNLTGLSEVEDYILKLRDLIPSKDKRLIFQMCNNIEMTRDQLINQNFFDFLNEQFKPDELMDLIENPRTFDEVRHFQIRKVKKTIEKDWKQERVIHEEVLATKVLPNKIVGFYGNHATTILWNTAIGLAKDKDLKIILLDLNPNTHLSLQFSFDRFLNLRCMSEVIQYLRRDQLNKDTIQQFLVQHNKFKNIYLLPGFKKINEKNFFDFPEAEEGEYLSRILYLLRRNANIVLVDTPRQFFFGATIDTVKEADTMYFSTTPYLPHRTDTKIATKYFSDKEGNSDFRLIISGIAGQDAVTPKGIFTELKNVKQYTPLGKETGSLEVFKDYLILPRISGVDNIIEDRGYPYEILEEYRNSINSIVKDIYYYGGGEKLGKKSLRGKTKSNQKFSFSKFFSRQSAN